MENKENKEVVDTFEEIEVDMTSCGACAISKLQPY